MSTAQWFILGQLLLNVGAAIAYAVRLRWPLTLLYAAWALASAALMLVDGER